MADDLSLMLAQLADQMEEAGDPRAPVLQMLRDGDVSMTDLKFECERDEVDRRIIVTGEATCRVRVSYPVVDNELELRWHGPRGFVDFIQGLCGRIGKKLCCSHLDERQVSKVCFQLWDEL